MSVIKREYLHTYYGFDTASEYNRKFFINLRANQDEAKSSIFYCHPDVYAGWGDELVKRWTLESWDRWGSEKPSWFTEAWVNHVPNEHVPYDWRLKYKKTNGRVNDAQLKKRRGSVSVRELLGGKEDR